MDKIQPIQHDNFTNYLIEKLNTNEEKQFALHFKLFLE